MTRIKLSMTTQDVVLAMGEGNLGALRTCMELLTHGDQIDPDAAMGGGLSALLSLDTLGIYGSRLYMLWSDVCKREIKLVLALLRAYQLGGLAGVTETTLNHAIDHRGDGLGIDAALEAVKERLPLFGLEIDKANKAICAQGPPAD